jgi:N-acetylglucosaminyldiphosphoundecaprenol N-acetyl-beta-D-mannosaminyltransferase
MKNNNWTKTQILNVKVEFPSLEQAVSWVSEAIKYNKVVQITTPNPEQVVLAQKDREFFKVLNSSDLAICDGIGLCLVAKKKLSDRITGTDLMLALCKEAAKKNWKIFLLGGETEVAKKTARILNAEYSQGSEDIAKETDKENQEIIKKINAFKPHLLFVAYGAPYQELWLAKNLPKLKVNVGMGVGGAFDYISGKIRRAPEWLQSIGLEWLWRLVCQPWRLKRQLALLKFVYLVRYH